MINVSKPFLPPEHEYQKYVQEIWQRNWLTNNGPLVNELELKLKDLLDVPHMLYLANGTIALQMAIKALDLRGEIITTPFSYIATSNSILWEGCKPVYVDIEPQSFNIDAGKIEAAISDRTTGILATHVFGNPCNIEVIDSIAERYNLKVIYDAAHCFGTRYKGRSVFTYGDISTTSFHATKVFHTVEGGAVFTNDPDLLKKLAFMRNFGHNGPEKFACVGINAKNSEFHAAMGLCMLKYTDDILIKRRKQWLKYREVLKNLKVDFLDHLQDAEGYNYAYFPIVFPDEAIMNRSVEALNLQYIHPRRYFSPSLNTLEFLGGSYECPVSESVAARVVCLPLYDSLSFSEQDMIARILLRVQNN